ncbi:hypothetical protein N7470_002127 [Penicillium chermesinum]|nr:hypothetical protein N7470_002127 [Penicillium chermesinum]
MIRAISAGATRSTRSMKEDTRERYESQYNDRQHGRDTLRRSRGYHDYDRSESYGSGLPYNDDEYDHHKQNRQRSFSPYRARKPKQYEDSGRSNEFVPKQEMNEAKTPNSPVSKEPASHQVKVADKPNDQSTSEVVGQTEQEPLDEEAIREERRRKRAAIRAKYQAGSEAKSPAETEVKSRAETEAGVLHLKALQVGPEVEASTPGTNAGSTRETTGMSHVHIPIPVLEQADVFPNLSTDSPQITPGKAGLSAADYDPVLDTKEDRSKHGITPTTTQDVSSAASDETKPATQDTSAPNAPHRAPKKDAFDMFALDDDVDMFGEGPESIAPEAGRELAASMMDDWNDSEGYYKIQLGELIKQQYVVKETIGKGVFSTVVRAYDKKAQNMVAIKIVRQNESMRKTGFREIGILGKLRKADPDDKHHLIMYKQHFDHKGHLCMVFENLSMDLRTVIRKYGLTSGLKLDDVRKYGRQMFVALKLLRACEIVHADIKPDNLLVNETRDFLKLCDLGSAAPIEEDEVAPYLVSRFYRAPEVILGCKRDYAVDVWSVGCTLYELLTGEILFTGRNNNQMLRVIMECRGKIPTQGGASWGMLTAPLRPASRVCQPRDQRDDWPARDPQSGFQAADPGPQEPRLGQKATQASGE